MMAAGRAAACGAPVLLLEKKDRLGLKLRITGKGRCNLTNATDMDDFVSHFGPTGRFLYRAFSRFFSAELRAFFAARGVPTVVERGQRVFPASNEARHIVDALCQYLGEHGVSIQYNTPVTQLLTKDQRIIGVQTGAGRTLHAPCVILATGGASYPLTGSTGDGYRLAAEVGHRIVPIRPALVPLETEELWAAALQGLSLRNVQVSLLLDGRPLAREFGEMLFTHFGVSGPLILTLSKRAVAALERGRVELSIDLKPALNDEQLDQRLRRELERSGRRSFRNILKTLLPLRLRDPFIALTGIPADKPGHQITGEERQRIHRQLRDMRLTVKAPRPLSEAIVTAGGVDINEIEPRTMESKLIQGLYFCGEVIDIDADTGGYNLQAAFSTGFLAGESAAAAWQQRAARDGDAGVR
mgnify:CR=1 FL=1